LQYRHANAHGNPYLKLLRSEVETWARKKHGKHNLEKKAIQNELNTTDKEIRKLKRQLTTLEKKKRELSKGCDLDIMYKVSPVCHY